MSQSDTQYMRRAFALARQATGRTAPNPMVGCVVVRDGCIIAEGYHRGPGHLHAETDALAGQDVHGATAYVTLEPCHHHGSNPPCTDAFIKAGIIEVVYGAADPNPVAAGGAKALAAAGLHVRQAQGQDRLEAEDLIAPWVFSLLHDRPYVYAKIAMTLDGRTATRTGQSKWITGEAARAKGHALRQRCDGILVGVGTVLADNPGLDARLAAMPEWEDAVTSVKIILDTHLRTPTTAKCFATPGAVILACGPDADDSRCAALSAAGAQVQSYPLDNEARVDLNAVLCSLKAQGMVSVMIEGGAALLGSAFDQALVNEVWAFIAPIIFAGGQPAINGRGPAEISQALMLDDLYTENLGRDILLRGKTKQEARQCLQA